MQESTKELRNNNLYTTFPKNQYSKNVISIGFYMSFLILPDNQIKITYHIIDVMFKYTNSLIPYEIGYAYKIDSFYFIQNQPMPIYDDAKYPSTTQSEPDTLLDIYNIDTQKNIVNYIVNTLSNRIIQLQQLINQH